MELLKKKNYLALIQNTAKGENWMFRNVYAKIGDQEVDILENGGLSCALVVSAILYFNKLIGDIHANVSSTVRDMLAHGWSETNTLEPGVVILWEKLIGDNDGKMHDHLGFYLGEDRAMSNDSRGTGFPHVHHYTYEGKRNISKIFTHNILRD